MRMNLPVSANEYVYPDGLTLVSTTDLKSRITYCNPAFIEVSGYEREELLGQPHNMIRHPDMPAEAFRDMWETIALGLPWSGMVKNRRKNGDHYWVLANVTPSVDAQGNTLGYYSVRRKPNPKATTVIAGLYRDMLEAETRVGSRDAIEASSQILHQFLKSKGQTYEQAVLSLQSL
mgnify:CR=1 FL=1